MLRSVTLYLYFPDSVRVTEFKRIHYDLKDIFSVDIGIQVDYSPSALDFNPSARIMIVSTAVLYGSAQFFPFSLVVEI